jgi:branched-chain amino acid transport system ATP-binding protein
MLTSAAVLDVDRLSVAYGHVQAVEDVSLVVEQGELVALLGANGAGKSTLLRSISGLVAPVGGEIRLAGERIDVLSPDATARRGVAHVPEGRRVIAPLTVRENLEVAALASRRSSRRELGGLLEEVFTTFPRLKERQRQASGLMSGGEQQMLAIGRAMMAKPVVLMLDEPSMGLAPVIVDEIYDLLKARTGSLADVSILLAEQSAELALEVADRAYVLSRGRLSFAGPVADLDAEHMVAAYLGAPLET